MSLYLSLYIVDIPVNYTSQFRKNFEANPYKQKHKKWKEKVLPKRWY